MNRRKWLLGALLALPAAVLGGWAYANARAGAAGYTCPLTGEQLPCPKCCPLNQPTEQTAAKKDTEQPKPNAGEGYTCPLTGEQLPCPCCCPLNKKK